MLTLMIAVTGIMFRDIKPAPPSSPTM